MPPEYAVHLADLVVERMEISDYLEKQNNESNTVAIISIPAFK